MMFHFLVLSPTITCDCTYLEGVVEEFTWAGDNTKWNNLKDMGTRIFIKMHIKILNGSVFTIDSLLQLSFTTLDILV